MAIIVDHSQQRTSVYHHECSPKLSHYYMINAQLLHFMCVKPAITDLGIYILLGTHLHTYRESWGLTVCLAAQSPHYRVNRGLHSCNGSCVCMYRRTWVVPENQDSVPVSSAAQGTLHIWHTKYNRDTNKASKTWMQSACQTFTCCTYITRVIELRYVEHSLTENGVHVSASQPI